MERKKEREKETKKERKRTDIGNVSIISKSLRNRLNFRNDDYFSYELILYNLLHLVLNRILVMISLLHLADLN